MTIPAGRKSKHGIVQRCLLTGIALIIRGDLLCFFGPELRARSRDIACHIVFYSGVVLNFGSAIFYLSSGR
jgi:hypothetical protein